MQYLIKGCLVLFCIALIGCGRPSFGEAQPIGDPALSIIALSDLERRSQSFPLPLLSDDLMVSVVSVQDISYRLTVVGRVSNGFSSGDLCVGRDPDALQVLCATDQKVRAIDDEWSYTYTVIGGEFASEFGEDPTSVRNGIIRFAGVVEK